MRAKKADIWVSVIIYTLIAAVALFIILQGGIPMLQKLRERAAYTRMKDVMISMDKQVSELSYEGEGSQRIFPLEMREGKMKVEGSSVFWEYSTDSEIISPRSSNKVGNLLIASNANVRTFDNGTYFLLENKVDNDTFRAKIRKLGTSSSWVPVSTADFIEYLSFNDQKMDGVFNFSLSENPDSASGLGYTELVPSGNNSYLGWAKAVMHINSSYAEYDLEIMMESYSDYVTAKVRNFRPN
jgi:hypothetical protein